MRASLRVGSLLIGFVLATSACADTSHIAVTTNGRPQSFVDSEASVTGGSLDRVVVVCGIVTRHEGSADERVCVDFMLDDEFLMRRPLPLTLTVAGQFLRAASAPFVSTFAMARGNDPSVQYVETSYQCATCTVQPDSDVRGTIVLETGTPQRLAGHLSLDFVALDRSNPFDTHVDASFDAAVMPRR